MGTIKLPQELDTAVRWETAGAFAFRYAAARSADAAAAGDASQDFLLIDHTAESLRFALCDGVSQSFYGGLAAKLLGTALVTWLADGLPPVMDHPQVDEALRAAITELTAAAGRAVEEVVLPDSLPPLLREVMEQKRAWGSESMFLCGRLDGACPDFPRGRLVLAWMGDSRLRLWEDGGEIEIRSGRAGSTMSRWSSRRGLAGPGPGLLVKPLGGTVRLLAYSDGLAVLDESREPLSDPALMSLIQFTGGMPTSDDVSLLEVWVGTPPVFWGR